MTNEHVPFLNQLFADVGARCSVEFRVEDDQVWGKLTLSDDQSPASIHDWPVPFLADSDTKRVREFAEAAAQNLRANADRVSFELTMEDVLEPAILAQQELQTREQFTVAFNSTWASASYLWAEPRS